jgi:hypothetical protein
MESSISLLPRPGVVDHAQHHSPQHRSDNSLCCCTFPTTPAALLSQVPHADSTLHLGARVLLLCAPAITAVQAAAALQLSVRPAWLSSFLAASQPKLQQLDAAQLASLASSLATLSTTAAPAGASSSSSSSSSKHQEQKQGQRFKVSGAWVKAWMDCSKQCLSELQGKIRDQEKQQLQAAQEAAAAAAAADGAAAAADGGAADAPKAAPKADQAAAAAKPRSKPAAAPGALIGQLALAALELGVLSKPAAAAAADGGVQQQQGPSATPAERISWIASLAAATATAAAAVSSEALDAAAASQILGALTAQQQEQPGLLQQLDVHFRQHAGSNGSNASYVLSIVAAVAAAAKGNMAMSGSDVLLRLMRALVVFGVQPGTALGLLKAAAEAAWLCLTSWFRFTN